MFLLTCPRCAEFNPSTSVCCDECGAGLLVAGRKTPLDAPEKKKPLCERADEEEVYVSREPSYLGQLVDDAQPQAGEGWSIS